MSFDENFLDEVIYMSIVNHEFFSLVKMHLKGSYFPNELYRDIWDEIVFQNDYYESSGSTRKRITFGIIKINLRKNREAFRLLDRIKNKEDYKLDTEKLIFELEEYIRNAMFVENYEQLAKMYNEKNGKKKAFAHFVKVSEEFSNFTLQTEHNFDRVFGDYSKREMRRLQDAQLGSILDNQIPFGISSLDAIFEGGAKRGEATLVCGATGSGKSFFAIWVGLAAARRGINVLHIQLEGTKQQVQDRYDSAWTGTLYHDLKKLNSIDESKQLKIDKTLTKMGAEIYVKAYTKFESVSMNEIRSFLLTLLKEVDIGLVIIDYFELVEPGDRRYSPGEERQRQDKLGKMFKALAVETNTHIFTPTQASEVSQDKLKDPRFVLTQSDLGDNKTKPKPFDNFLTLNQTLHERQNRTLRIWVDKLREGDSKKIVIIGQDLASSRFYSAQKTRRILEEIEFKRQLMTQNNEDDE